MTPRCLLRRQRELLSKGKRIELRKACRWLNRVCLLRFRGSGSRRLAFIYFADLYGRLGVVFVRSKHRKGALKKKYLVWTQPPTSGSVIRSFETSSSNARQWDGNAASTTSSFRRVSNLNPKSSETAFRKCLFFEWRLERVTEKRFLSTETGTQRGTLVCLFRTTSWTVSLLSSVYLDKIED